MELVPVYIRHSRNASPLPADRTLLMARLAAARRRAKLGQDQIDHQRQVIATLFANGSDIDEAENRLRVYEKLHDKYLADIQRILNALDDVLH
jgi:hypothetical protein